MIDRTILRKRAREMRLNPTEPEKRLWRHLSNSQLDGHKFRRQAVIEPYIADFLCPQKSLIVEVDGDTHEQAKDVERDKALQKSGFRTIRFANEDIMQNMDGVLLALKEALKGAPDRWSREGVSSTPTQFRVDHAPSMILNGRGPFNPNLLKRRGF